MDRNRSCFAVRSKLLPFELEITRRSVCNNFTISLQNETHSSDSAAIEEDGRVEQFTYNPVFHSFVTNVYF